jgi:AraC-like DNA-binding protein
MGRMRAPDTETPHSTICLWPGRFLMVARSVNNRPHRHLAASLLIALGDDFRLRIGQKTELRCRLALVAPDVEQCMDSGDQPVAVIHVDPDLDGWRQLRPLLGRRHHCHPDDSSITALRAQLLGALESGLDCAQAGRLFDDTVKALAGVHCPAPLDPRIAALTRKLRSQAPNFPPLATLAAAVGLSESRLMHLFKQEMGVTLRRFMLNLRLQSAMRLWRPGMNLAALAADAGFYDQPHLARTAREVFDALPSLYADNRRIRVVNCPM